MQSKSIKAGGSPGLTTCRPSRRTCPRPLASPSLRRCSPPPTSRLDIPTRPARKSLARGPNRISTQPGGSFDGLGASCVDQGIAEVPATDRGTVPDSADDPVRLPSTRRRSQRQRCGFGCSVPSFPEEERHRQGLHAPSRVGSQASCRLPMLHAGGIPRALKTPEHREGGAGGGNPNSFVAGYAPCHTNRDQPSTSGRTFSKIANRFLLGSSNA